MVDSDKTDYPDRARYDSCVRDIGVLLQRTSHLFQMMEREQRKETGFTGSQAFLLTELQERGEMSMMEAGRRLNLEKSSVTRLAGTLIRTGLAETRPDREDRRVQLIRLTDRGRLTADAVRKSREEYYERIVSLLPRGHVREVMSSAEVLFGALEQASTAG